MAKRSIKWKRRSFSPEFKSDAVRLCNTTGESIGQVAERLDLTETAQREWVKRADADAGEGAPEVLTTVERDELRELRKRVKRLEMERVIFKNPRPSSRRRTGEGLRLSDGAGRGLHVHVDRMGSVPGYEIKDRSYSRAQAANGHPRSPSQRLGRCERTNTMGTRVPRPRLYGFRTPP